MGTQKISWLLFVFFLASCSATPAVIPTIPIPTKPMPTASRTVGIMRAATQTAGPTIDHWSTPTPTSDFPTPSYPLSDPGVFINPIAKLGKDKGFVREIIWAPDGATYVIHDDIYGLNIFDTNTNQKLHFIQDSFGSVYYSPDSRLIAVRAPYEIFFMEVRSGQVITRFSVDSFISAAFSSDGNQFAYMVACGEICNNPIHIWDIAEQKETLVISPEQPNNEFSLKKILFDPTGTFLLALTNQDVIHVFELETGALKFKLFGSVKSFDDFLFSKDGKYLAAYAEDKEGFNALAWEWDTREQQRSITAKWDDLEPFADAIHKVDFSEDGSQLEVMINTHSTLRYRIANGAISRGKKWTDPSEILLYQLQLADGTYNTDIDALAYSPDGQTLAVGSYTGPLRLWDLKTQKIRTMLDTTAKRIQYNHKGDRLIVLNETDERYDEISIWDTVQNVKMHILLKTRYVEDFVIFDDDLTLAMYISNAQEERVELWDIERGLRIRTLYTSREWHESNFLSYDSDEHFLYLVQASYMKEAEDKEAQDKETENGYQTDVSIRSWDILTGVALPERVTSFPFRFSLGFVHLQPPQDDKLVISWNDVVKGDIELWDMKTGKKINLAYILSQKAKKISLPTGDAILAVFGDYNSFLDVNFSIYDLKTGRQLYYFSNDRSNLLRAFNLAGSQMAVRDKNGTIVISDVSIVTK
jgi:WD40 repeat protein